MIEPGRRVATAIVEARGTVVEYASTFLINMDRSAERLAFMGDRLRALGIAYTRIAAADGGAMSQTERGEFSGQRPRDGKRGWRPGQIGCFLSHWEAWLRTETGATKWALILEDDLHLSDALPIVLEQLDRLPADADIVRLETTGQWLKLAPASAVMGESSVRRVQSSAWGAGAYLLTKSAAARLIGSDPTNHSPVDDFLFNFANSPTARGLTTYQLVPALAVQDKFNEDRQDFREFGSDIETDRVNGRLPSLAAWRRAVTSFLRGKTPVRSARK